METTKRSAAGGTIANATSTSRAGSGRRAGGSLQAAVHAASTQRSSVATKNAPGAAPTKASARSVQFKKAAAVGIGGEPIPAEERVERVKARRVPKENTPPQLRAQKPTGLGKVSRTALLELEARMRKAVVKQRPIYSTDKEVLMGVFAVYDDGSGALEVPEFIQAWAKLKVEVSWEEAQALFKVHPTNNSGGLRYVQFVNNLLQGAARATGQEPVCMGYPVSDADFKRKIIYPKCRKGVMAPTNFDLSLADRSTFAPTAQLRLSFVYGYGGLHNTAPNLFYTCTGEVVYYTAAVCVVYDRERHTQRFFLQHTDDIKCLAICEAPVTFAGEHYPARSLVASGQVKPVEDAATEERECPFIIIWDIRTCQEVARIVHDETDRAVVGAAFSPSGEKLVTVTSDNNHTVRLWAWRTRNVGQVQPSGKVLGLQGEGKGYKERPIAVYGVVWNKYSRYEQFATYGYKHVKIWAEVNGRWLGTSCKFGKLKIDNCVSCTFLPPKPGTEESAIVTGMPGGKIYLWRGRQAVRAVSAHARGPEVITSDGSVTFGGVRVLRVRADGQTLLSGGADGKVHLWEVSHGSLSDGDKKSSGISLHRPGLKGAAPAIRALDCMPGSDVFVAGTNCCDLWEVDDSPEVLVHGHAGAVAHVAPHPTKPDTFVSVDELGHAYVWNADMRTLIRSCNVRFSIRACSMSQAPLGRSAMDNTPSHHFALGGQGGKLVVLDESNLQPIYQDNWAASTISVLKFSPNNEFLAVGSHDTCVYVYRTGGRDVGYKRLAQCRGHSSTVTQMDWSADSTVLMTNDQSYEILMWDPRAGKKVVHAQNNQAWHTWTCTLGFPVMGIWREGNDGTDINAACRSHSGEYLVTADDYSSVHLFNYPCVVEEAPSRTYRGHCSHVACVRFTADDRRVISCGGIDRAIFMFETHGMTPEWEWRNGKRQLLPNEDPQCDLEQCRTCGKRGQPPIPPKCWGPLDETGKKMGWVQPPRPTHWPEEEGDQSAHGHVESDVHLEAVDA